MFILHGKTTEIHPHEFTSKESSAHSEYKLVYLYGTVK